MAITKRPRIIYLNDYSIPVAELLLYGGGKVSVVDTEAFWKKINSFPPEQPIILATKDALGGKFDIFPQPATKIYHSESGLLYGLAFYFALTSAENTVTEARCSITATLKKDPERPWVYTGDGVVAAVVSQHTVSDVL